MARYSIEPMNGKFNLYCDGRKIAVLNTFAEADYFLGRMNSPNYPFSDSMVFCSAHTRDSDLVDVAECTDCHAGRV